MTKLIRSLENLLFPRYCAGCGIRLALCEALVCPSCTLRMEREQICDWSLTPMIKNFAATGCVPRCGNFVRFRRHSIVANIVHNLKYYRQHQLGAWMGYLAATELAETHLFDDIDLLIPIPLSLRRRLQRGYNQSALIAQGISEVIHIPVRDDLLLRPTTGESQTHFTIIERMQRGMKMFRLAPNADVILSGLHIMLVDDVLTTGTTMRAAIEVLSAVPSITIVPFAWSRATS